MPIDQSEITDPAPTAGGAPTPPDDTDAESPTTGPPRRWRILIGVAAGVVVCLLLGLLGGWAAYASTDLPEIPAPNEATRIQYSDGGTFAAFASKNRTSVSLGDVPKHAQDAVLAARDPDFYRSGGSAPGAIVRAARALVTGGGGESLTEQYVRVVFAEDPGRSAHARTTVLAHKLNQRWSKEQILKAYLNTVYFGRGAWGIQAASEAYFRTDVSKLTVAQAAVLAAVIADPKQDPRSDPGDAKRRWAVVLDTMVDRGTLSAAERDAQEYPAVLDAAPRSDAWKGGTSGVLGQRIESELKKIGFSTLDIATGGLTVNTTISSTAQAAAVRAASTHVKPGSEGETAVVSIDPRTGAVKAYVGGDRGYGNADLASAVASHPAGASFEPFALATAITQGYSIDSLWNGTSGQVFDDAAKPVANAGGDSSCGPRCSLTAATVKSVNTVYWALTSQVGPKQVAETAEKAGIRTLNGRPTRLQREVGVDSSLGLGRFSVSVLDQAAAYTTIANNGVYREPHLIDRVLDSDGTVLWDSATHASRAVDAWSRPVGQDVSYALQQAYDADPAVRIGRPAAIKSGGLRDPQGRSDAWLAGYTPQLATVVWVGSRIPERGKTSGSTDLRGSGVPGAIWRDYMVAALKSQPVEKFAPPARVGDKPGNAR